MEGIKHPPEVSSINPSLGFEPVVMNGQLDFACLLDLHESNCNFKFRKLFDDNVVTIRHEDIALLVSDQLLDKGPRTISQA